MPIHIAGTQLAEAMRRKALLLSKLAEIQGAPRNTQDLQIEYLADPLDQVRSSADREMAVQRLDRQTRLIHDIESAIAKIDEGVYGLCERCEELIPRRRLDVMPWARQCVACQEKSEARVGEHWTAFEAAA